MLTQPTYRQRELQTPNLFGRLHVDRHGTITDYPVGGKRPCAHGLYEPVEGTALGANVPQRVPKDGKSRPYPNVPDPVFFVCSAMILKRAAPRPQNCDLVVATHPPLRHLREVALGAARTWV